MLGRLREQIEIYWKFREKMLKNLMNLSDDILHKKFGCRLTLNPTTQKHYAIFVDVFDTNRPRPPKQRLPQHIYYEMTTTLPLTKTKVKMVNDVDDVKTLNGHHHQHHPEQYHQQQQQQQSPTNDDEHINSSSSIIHHEQQRRLPIVLCPNDFPYALDTGISHYLVWCPHPLDEHIVHKIIDAELSTQNFSDFLHFVNPPHLQTVPNLWHAHIFARQQRRHSDDDNGGNNIYVNNSDDAAAVDAAAAAADASNGEVQDSVLAKADSAAAAAAEDNMKNHHHHYHQLSSKMANNLRRCE